MVNLDEVLERLQEIHMEYCSMCEDDEPCGCSISLLISDVFIATMPPNTVCTGQVAGASALEVLSTPELGPAKPVYAELSATCR